MARKRAPTRAGSAIPSGRPSRHWQTGLAAFMEASTDAFVMLDEKLNVVALNPAGEKLAGLSEVAAGRATGNHVLDHKPDIKESGVYQRYLDVMETGEPLTYDHVIDNPEFGLMYLSVKAFKVGDGLGLTISDVTARRVAEEALEAAGIQWQRTFDAVGDALSIIDLDGKILQCNAEMGRLAARPPGEVVGLTCWEIMHGASGPLEGCPIARMRESGQREMLTVAEGDRWFEVTANPLVDQEGTLHGAVHSMRDVTERKRTEEALRESVATWGSLVKHLPDYVSILDLDAKILFNNRVVPGLTVEEVIGRSNFDYLPAESHSEAKDCYERVLTTGEPAMFVTTFNTKAGESRYFEVHNGPLFKDGEIVAFVVRSTDITERRLAEEALRESQEKLRHILDCSRDAIYRLDLRTSTYDYYSPASRDILGYSPEEFKALGPERALSLVHPDDRAALDKNIMSLVAPSGEPLALAVEYRVQHRELGYRWVSDNRSVLFDENGQPIAVVGSLRDVTEQRQAEEALRRSEEYYKSLIQNAMDVVVVIDSDGIIHFESPSSEEVLGYTPEELIGQDGFDFVHPDDLPIMTQALAEVMQGACATVRVEIRVRHRNGSWLTVATVARNRLSDPTVSGIVVNFRDVTERRRAEEALRRSEERYRLLAENVSDVISATDSNGRPTFVSPSYEALTGFTPEEAMSRTMEESLTPESLKAAAEALSGGKHDPSKSVLELEFYRKDGSTIWVEARVSPACDSKGEPTGFVNVLCDITERRRAEAALRESEERHRALFETMTQGVIYHDAEGAVIAINPAAERIMGPEARTWRASDPERPGWKLVREDGSVFARDEHPLRIALNEGKEARDVVMGMRGLDDNVRLWFRTSLFPMFKLGEDKPFQVYTVSEDITERKKAEEELERHRFHLEEMVDERTCELRQANESLNAEINERRRIEEALQESETRYRTVADFTYDWESWEAPDGGLRYVSPACLRITGYDAGEFVANPGLMLEIVLPEDRPTWEEHKRTVREDPAVHEMQFRIMRQDGEVRWIEHACQPVRDARDGFLGTRASNRDITERKRMEEGQRLHGEITRNMSEGVMLVRAGDGVIVYTNPKFEEMFGYGPGEMFGKHVSIVNTPSDQDPEETAEEIMGILGETGEWHGEINNIRRDGTEFWCQASISVFDHHEHGSVMVSVHTDITKRKQAEEALRREKEFSESLIGSMQDGFVVMDAKGVHIDMNPAFCAMTGFSKDELVGVGVPHAFWPPEEMDAIEAAFEQTLRGDFASSELTFRRKNGERFAVIISPSWTNDDAGNVTSYFATVKDITERKRMEEELRAKEQWFRSVIENSLDFIAVVGVDGAFRYQSPSVADVLGHDSARWGARTAFGMIHPDDVSAASHLFTQLLENPTSAVHAEVRGWHRDGRWHTFNVIGRNLLDDPLVQGIVANFHDVTERKQAEEEFQGLYIEEKNLREQLEDEMRKRVEFTRVLAHELKTPLTPVLMSSQTLESQLKEGPLLALEPLIELAKNIHRGALNLNNRIDELLDLARGEVGMLTLKTDTVDMRGLLEELRAETASAASSAGKTLVLRRPRTLPPVCGDRTRLRQIVQNLLNNALKFTPAGGRVTMRAREEEGRLIVSVHNTGLGIKKEEQHRLFMPYSRLEQDRERLSGLGLGLALSKKLVDLHGGEIWVSSSPRKGSTFSFSLAAGAPDDTESEACEREA